MGKALTIGAVMDSLHAGKTVNIPVRTGKPSLARRLSEGKQNQPAPTLDEIPEFKSFDRLVRQSYRYFGSRLSDEVLLKAIDVVGEHTGLVVRDIRRMKLAEFTNTLDEAMGHKRFGPDHGHPILYWEGESRELRRLNWQFLLVVWGRNGMPFAEIAEAIWDDDRAPSNRIHQLISRVNKQLAKHHVPLAFKSDHEKVFPTQKWP